MSTLETLSGMALIGSQRILGCLMKHNSPLLYISLMTVTFFGVKKNLFPVKKKKKKATYTGIRSTSSLCQI